jgi:hypothetical protein
MCQKRKNISLFIGVGLMGLVAWSAVVAAAQTGSAECTAKVSAEMATLVKKNGGRHASAATQENLLIKCSEAQLGLVLEGVASKHAQETSTEKEVRCQTSVKYAVTNGKDTSGRSQEALVSDCMALPSDHDANCGYSSGDYAAIEAQKCVSKGSSIASTHGVMAKAEKRVRKFDEPSETIPGDSSSGVTGTSAQ